MNITPAQARELLDGATPGPWVKRRDQDGNPLPVVVSTSRGDRHHIMTADPAAAPERQQADTDLIAAATDLAHTIAGMRSEWRAEVREVWGAWLPVSNWTTEDDARLRLASNQLKGATTRLVRRLVGPVEVAE
ncbi:hypothetical protein ACYB2S_13835 [Corynebacterium variabile]|uniref:hypothetical protein n=1 Tax=Corynebacterium variabile TaxID=1727 RepID=UPI003CA9A33A